MVAEVMTSHALSQRRACGLIGFTRRGFQRAPTPDRNLHLRQRLRELAEERRRRGCPMLYLMLRREGCAPTISGSSDCIAKKGCHCGKGGGVSG
jgi:putative transposase